MIRARHTGKTFLRLGYGRFSLLHTRVLLKVKHSRTHEEVRDTFRWGQARGSFLLLVAVHVCSFRPTRRFVGPTYVESLHCCCRSLQHYYNTEAFVESAGTHTGTRANTCVNLHNLQHIP